MWVKICANTNLEDALAAAEFGADAVGFVFAPSKRQVTAAQVAAISPYLPPEVERVGVFAGNNLEAIAEAVVEAGLTAVQLHGGVDLIFAGRVRERLGPAVDLILTTHWSVDPDPGVQPAEQIRVAAALAEVAADPEPFRILVDARAGSASGGLGITFDWAAARSTLVADPRLRVIVAGGLRPDNVAEAIRQLQPWGVDVASGVEREPGRKDLEKLRLLIKNARGAL